LWLVIIIIYHFQWVVEVWPIYSIENQVNVLFKNSFFLNNILNLKYVQAHIIALINHLLLKVLCVKIHLLIRVYFASNRQLICNFLTIFFLWRLRINVSLFEEIN
jgi:hypothetical protein